MFNCHQPITKSFLLLSCLLFSACNFISFTAPHPSSQQALKQVDSVFVGTYYWADTLLKNPKNEEVIVNGRYINDYSKVRDSLEFVEAQLFVSAKLVYYQSRFTKVWNLDSLSPSYAAYQLKQSNRISSIKNNLLIQVENQSDTFLNLRKADKLYAYKGSLFLNHLYFKHKKTKLEEWSIAKLERAANGNYVLALTNDEDCKLICDNKEQHSLFNDASSISEKDFLLFVDQGGFRQRYNFKKIKDN